MLQSNCTEIQNYILNWYDIYHRKLPWRISPSNTNLEKTPDPYKIWLSEIMLQQTTVTTAKPYFIKFIEKWPTINDLASATNEEILVAWAGLGYYTRARNLKKCAEIIIDKYRGKFPDTEVSLKCLPGIGEYTAAAIAAIAFGHPALVIDGNIERVISRFFAINEPSPTSKGSVKKHLQTILPKSRPGDFSQALMDIGSLICMPKKTLCTICPIKRDCVAFSQGKPEFFPVKSEKKKKPLRVGAIFLAVTSNNDILLRKRTTGTLLAGMTELPTSNWTSKNDGETSSEAAPFFAEWHLCNNITHIFTHFKLTLSVWKTHIPQKIILSGSWWCPIENLNEEALPMVMKKALIAGGIKLRL
ncbi:A/G-specific adenine glycosylase [Liberibacter crescens BT-1]|uniref:Adenine DNA glycosylase n=1 Tax=Liberibacter crescens (strain BT-1) TaxID=1215343 RepID=L0EUT0_LIBCB|nr:A/G-specific adenine glycosylase [Liberibacter crescens]AGA65309.1 A/G-specific adenine glycosylase [Liberibacter crescens BT-1]AMC13239.1 adenine glycosylase [Liberibacter crescens]